MRYALGIDIGGTNTRVAFIDEYLNMVKRVQFGTLVEDPIGTIRKIQEVIKQYDNPIVGIGVSCPGPLDLKKGIVLTPPNLKQWHNLEIVNVMRDMLHVPVYLENDANLACLAEAIIGAGKTKSIVSFLTISTGVGAGMCIDKKIYQGAHGFAHEIANIIVWRDGPSMGDLKAGSIESIASGTAITKRCRQAGYEVRHAGDVARLALEGNQDAQQIMEDALEYLSNTVATIFALQDPDVIVISGSVALKIDGFIEVIEQRVKTKVYDNLKDYVHIVPAALQEDCGLIGAAYLAFTHT